MNSDSADTLPLLRARSPEGRAEIARRVDALSLEEKVELVSGASFWTTAANPRIGLRALVLSDGPSGVRGAVMSESDPSAALPNSVAVAATFDPELAERVGQLLGDEARRKGVDLLLAPTVNLQRSSYGGRNFEAFGEDPVLTAEIGGAVVSGIQSRGVGATVKHFLANDSETERLSLDAVVDDQVLRENYALPFEEIVRDHGVLAVMSSYNRINGVTGTETPLLADTLRAEWGFDGLVMSDWFAVRTVESAAHAGTDLAMPGPDTVWSAGLADAVRAGRVAVPDLDRKLTAILGVAAELGALDGFAPAIDTAALPTPARPDAEPVRDLLAELVTRSAVLLRNSEAALPLPKTIGSVAIIGPAARQLRLGGGGSSMVIPPDTKTPAEAIAAAFPTTRITAAEGFEQHELLPLLGDRSTTPQGERGYLVEFLGANDAVIGTEHRRGGLLVYGMGFPEGIDPNSVEAYRITLALDVTGPHRLGVAGIGTHRVTVDGEVVGEHRFVPDSDDPTAGLSSPPQFVLTRDMRPGERMELLFRPEPGSLVSFRIGLDEPQRSTAELRTEAVAAARDADAAIVIIGSSAADESEGFDRDTLTMGAEMDALVRAIAAENPRTIVVLNVGAPVLLPWRDEVAALLLVHFPGQEGSEGIARLLAGSAEPGGRLSASWPEREMAEPSVTPIDGVLRYTEGEDIGYRCTGESFAYRFGEGQGYTTWERTTDGIERLADGSIRAHGMLHNRGERRGRETVMLFLGRRSAGAVVRFAGAAIVEADPGGSGPWEIRVSAERGRRMFGADSGTLLAAVARSAAEQDATREV